MGRYTTSTLSHVEILQTTPKDEQSEDPSTNVSTVDSSETSPAKYETPLTSDQESELSELDNAAFSKYGFKADGETKHQSEPARRLKRRKSALEELDDDEEDEDDISLDLKSDEDVVTKPKRRASGRARKQIETIVYDDEEEVDDEDDESDYDGSAVEDEDEDDVDSVDFGASAAAGAQAPGGFIIDDDDDNAAVANPPVRAGSRRHRGRRNLLSRVRFSCTQSIPMTADESSRTVIKSDCTPDTRSSGPSGMSLTSCPRLKRLKPSSRMALL